MPTHFEENLPLPASRKPQQKQRKVSKGELRRQKFQYWVTVALAVIFIGSSVGVLILARPIGRSTQATQASVEETRLAGMREQALKSPKDPQWPYEIAQMLANKGDVDGAITQYNAALAIDAGYLPALQSLADLLIGQKKYADAQKILAQGIAAEKKDVEKLNKERGKDDPEVFQDPKLRFLLFDVDMELGPANAAEARTALREALAINPMVYAQFVQGWALKVALEGGDRKKADQGLQIAIDEARTAKETAVIEQLEKASKMIASFNAAPSGMPVAAPSGMPVPPPSGAPLAAPTELPQTTSSGAPVAVPQEVPVAVPSGAPMSAPSGMPATAPSTAP